MQDLMQDLTQPGPDRDGLGRSRRTNADGLDQSRGCGFLRPRLVQRDPDRDP